MGKIPCEKHVEGVRDLGLVLRPSKPGERYYDMDGDNAREGMLHREGGRYYLFYDSSAPSGKMRDAGCMLAVSDDLRTWEKLGPVVRPSATERPELDPFDVADYCGAGSPWLYHEGDTWYMYTCSSNGVREGFAPLPYYTTVLTAPELRGPWHKVNTEPGKNKHAALPVTRGTYYGASSSGGCVIQNPKWRGEGDPDNYRYLMFFSASAWVKDDPSSGKYRDSDVIPANSAPGEHLARGIAIARANDLLAGDDYDKNEGAFWRPDPEPLLPFEHDVENTSIFEQDGTYYLFTNHIDPSNSYTDEAWVYWTRDIDHWDPENRALAFSKAISKEVKGAIGMPFVMRLDEKTLAMTYDGAPGESYTHFGRGIGLCLIDLPLTIA